MTATKALSKVFSRLTDIRLAAYSKHDQLGVRQLQDQQLSCYNLSLALHAQNDGLFGTYRVHSMDLSGLMDMQP